MKTFQGISDALAAGDISLAAKVLWAMLKLEWQKGLAFLEGLWEGFKGFWSDAVTGLAIGFTSAVASIQSLWIDLTNALTKIWNRWATSTFEEGLADFIAPVMAKILGVDTEQLRKTMHEDFAAARKAQPANDAALDAQANARKQQIEKDRQATVDQLAQDKLRADKERQGRIDAAQDDVANARKELDDAVSKAREARDKVAAGGPAMPGHTPPKDIPEIGNLAAAKSKVEGTFSGYALGGLGSGDDVQKKMEGHLADSKEHLAAINDQTRELLAKAAGGGIVLG